MPTRHCRQPSCCSQRCLRRPGAASAAVRAGGLAAAFPEVPCPPGTLRNKTWKCQACRPPVSCATRASSLHRSRVCRAHTGPPSCRKPQRRPSHSRCGPKSGNTEHHDNSRHPPHSSPSSGSSLHPISALLAHPWPPGCALRSKPRQMPATKRLQNPWSAPSWSRGEGRRCNHPPPRATRPPRSPRSACLNPPLWLERARPCLHKAVQKNKTA
mmetsp:Transcript_89768/g.249343  ORF Transcript_89768/g.249343 Transcript_89768/m.249343 type:complete len:213 (+) Transcript_89768:843-1481(+)